MCRFIMTLYHRLLKNQGEIIKMRLEGNKCMKSLDDDRRWKCFQLI